MRTVSWDGLGVALDAPIRVPAPLSGSIDGYAFLLLAVASLTDVKVVGRFNGHEILCLPDDQVTDILHRYEYELEHTRHIGDDTDYFPGRDNP